MSFTEQVTSPEVVQEAAILLVEDDAGLREATQELIEMLGYSVVATGSARQARELLSLHTFRVLVADVRLDDGAGVTGVELANTARTLHPEIGLLLLSGKDLPGEGTELPADAEFLRKPYDFQEFADILEALT